MIKLFLHIALGQGEYLVMSAKRKPLKILTAFTAATIAAISGYGLSKALSVEAKILVYQSIENHLGTNPNQRPKDPNPPNPNPPNPNPKKPKLSQYSGFGTNEVR